MGCRYQTTDRDVTDEFSRFLVRRGYEELADRLYQNEVMTFATCEDDHIYVSCESDLVTSKLLEEFEDTLYYDWPSHYEGRDYDWKDDR